MDKDIKDYVFMQHFNPQREPSLSVKGCPYCGSTIHTIVKDQKVCFRCGKSWKDKEPHGN